MKTLGNVPSCEVSVFHWRNVSAVLAFVLLASIAPLRAEQVTWGFDDVQHVGGFRTEVEGQPALIDSPVGKAIQFNGKDQSLFVAGRGLVGARTFTIEAIFRPEGGPFQQRFVHIAETDPVTGLDARPTGTNDPNPRFMFEVRVEGGSWYLDAFVNSKAGNKPLIFPDKRHPLNQWYAVQQTYDGKTYRAYVDGILQGEGDVAFTPHGPGHVRIGARMNRIDYFTGSVAKVRFTDRALSPAEFLQLPK